MTNSHMLLAALTAAADLHNEHLAAADIRAEAEAHVAHRAAKKFRALMSAMRQLTCESDSADFHAAAVAARAAGYTALADALRQLSDEA